MGVIQAIINGFTLVAKNFKLWGLMAVIAIGLMIITIPAITAIFGSAAGLQPGIAPTPEDMAGINWFLLILFVIVMALVQTFINAGAVASIRDIIKTDTLNLGNFLPYAKKFFVRFILFGLVLVLIMLGIGLILALLMMIVGLIGNAVTFLGVVLGAVLFIAVLAVLILIGVCGTFGTVIIVCDDVGVIKALGKAVDFVKGKLWKAVGLLLILVVIMIILSWINNALAAQGGPTGMLSQVIIGLINIYLGLVLTASFMSFYLGNVEAAPPSAPQTGQA